MYLVQRMLLATTALISLAAFPKLLLADDAENKARELFQNITGVPIQSTDTRLASMKSLVTAGKLLEAAAIATDDDNFYNVTLRSWAALMDGREESILNPLTDYQLLLIGAVRDNKDFRTTLTGTYTYASKSGLSTGEMDVKNTKLKQELQEKTQVSATNPAPSGVFTTSSWASNHYNGGTNRRAVEYTFRQFLCTPIAVWKDVGLPEDRIRRDVDRAPSGNAANFQSLCRTCHSGMDALAGAFANYDFDPNRGQMIYLGTEIASKYARNAQTYPEGYQTQDASFVNYSTQHHNASLGWRGPLTGTGLTEFATMISNSSAYSKCMVTRAFRSVCNRDPAATDSAAIERWITELESGSYNLKSTFQSIAISPNCAKNP